MNSFTDICDAWPTPESLATDLGKSVWAIHKWRQRDKIPAYDWLKLIAAAKKRRIRGITLEVLASIAEKKEAA